MTRVEWTRTEPGDIEQVVSMLLCRENPSAVRVRASRGDGGIDVLAPAENGAGVAVYQVKSFSSNLTASQKAQVEILPPGPGLCQGPRAPDDRVVLDAAN